MRHRVTVRNKTLYNRFVRWGKASGPTCSRCLRARAGLLLDNSAVKAHRCARGGKGERTQAISRSRGGRTTKRCALTNGAGRPLTFLPTGGQAFDCRTGERLVDHLPPGILVHADRGYDTDRIRRLIEAVGCAPNIPSKANRRWKNSFSPYLYQ